MRTVLLLVVSIMTLAYGPTASADRKDDIDQIEALYAAWRSAVASADIAGYVGVLHADISLRPPGAPGLDGRENYREFLGPVFDSARYAIRIDNPPRATLLGDSAIVEYDYTILRQVIPNAGAELAPGALVAAETSAHYIDFVTKNAEGRWKVRLHSWQDWPSGP